MATIKTPIRIGDDTPLRNFQTGEAVGTDHGGTGIVTAELAGQGGKYLKVNSGENGYEFDAPAGGGDGIYGGSGTVPANTTASVSGQDGSLTFGVGYSSYPSITIGDPSGANGTAQIEAVQGSDGPGYGVIQAITFNNSFEAASLRLAGNSIAFQGTGGEFIAGEQFNFEVTSGSGIMRFKGPGQKVFSSDAGIAAEYADDYSADMATNNLKIPSVGFVKSLIAPPQYDNGSAPFNTIFYSLDDGKLSYKDPGGSVYNLY